MNKAEIIDAVAAETGFTKTASGEFVDAFLKTVFNSLVEGDSVQLIGFGSFSVAQTAARKGRNPRTGETIKIAAGKRIKFAVGAKLKDAINAGKK